MREEGERKKSENHFRVNERRPLLPILRLLHFSSSTFSLLQDITRLPIDQSLILIFLKRMISNRVLFCQKTFMIPKLTMF